MGPICHGPCRRLPKRALAASKSGTSLENASGPPHELVQKLRRPASHQGHRAEHRILRPTDPHVARSPYQMVKDLRTSVETSDVSAVPPTAAQSYSPTPRSPQRGRGHEIGRLGKGAAISAHQGVVLGLDPTLHFLRPRPGMEEMRDSTGAKGLVLQAWHRARAAAAGLVAEKAPVSAGRVARG